jgi:hypothetical protein
MSHLIIVDLDHADELSSFSMGMVAGGMSCDNALAVSDAYYAFGDILTGMGDKETAATYYGRADGMVDGACFSPSNIR